MFVRSACLFVAVIFIIFGDYVGSSETTSRQKRCIVVQKQSGSRDADDDDDEDWQPRPKIPHPDRITDDVRRSVVEGIPAKLLKLTTNPKRLNNRIVLRNKFIRDYLNYKNLSQYF